MENTIQVPKWTSTASPTSSPRGSHVPRWSPSPSPPSSPEGDMKSESFEPDPPSAQGGNQVRRWNPNKPNTSSPRGPMQNESFEPSSTKGTHLPTWNQSPSRPSSPKRQMRNENFDELGMGTHLPTWTQNLIPPSSPKGAMKNESSELSPPSSSGASHVPRWTPSPSPPRSPKGPTRNKSFDDLERGSVASEEEDMSSNMEKFFPFNSDSISASTRTPLDSLLLQAPSLKNLSKVKTSWLEPAAERPKQNKNDVTWNMDTDFTSKSNGVFLTWKDLWVTVPDRQSGRRPILQLLTGYAEPGEVLAIMGPSGCGKSTLLDALAGRLGSNTRQRGEILVNGRKQRLAFGTSVSRLRKDRQNSEHIL